MRPAGGFAALLALTAGPAAAYVSAAGHFYEVACNPSGFVLTSTYPVGRFFGQGAGTTISDDREAIYLGASCNATRAGFPNGAWGWANGGFRVDIPGLAIGFPRQEPHCRGDETVDIEPCRF